MGPVEKNLREYKRLVDEEKSDLETSFAVSAAYPTLPSVVKVVVFDGILQRRATSDMLENEIRLASIDNL